MGLDFVGSNARWSYSGFSSFRRKLASEVGVTLNNMDGFGGSQEWPKLKDPVLVLLNHSDCDGHLTPKECSKLAPRLRELVKDWPKKDYDRQQALKLASGMANCAKTKKRLLFT